MDIIHGWHNYVYVRVIIVDYQGNNSSQSGVNSEYITSLVNTYYHINTRTYS